MQANSPMLLADIKLLRGSNEKLQGSNEKLQDRLEILKDRLAKAGQREDSEQYGILVEQMQNAQKDLANTVASTEKMATQVVDARASAKYHETVSKQVQSQVQDIVSQTQTMRKAIAGIDHALVATAEYAENSSSGSTRPNTRPGTQEMFVQATHGPVERLPPTHPTSRGRRVSSPRALKKSRIHEQGHSGTGHVSGFSREGRRIYVFDDDEEEDAAHVESAERLLKLVDEDFADIKSSRRAMGDLLMPPGGSKKPGVPKLNLKSDMKPHPPPAPYTQRGEQAKRASYKVGSLTDRSGEPKHRQDLNKLPALFPYSKR
mmetsp:Transcript_46874/g.73373  ORF Transcript_46874/g.73373 Transcript_46874/m.73373 type:complete len:318 (+) Transcript_46874:3-956(+)